MSEEPQAARFTKAFTSAQEAAVAAVEDEAPEARRRPLPVRVQLERGGPLYDGLLGGWRLEGRRVFAIVEVPGRAEPLAVDPWDLYPSTAGERRTEHTEAFRRLVEGPPEPCPPKRRARRRAGTKGGQAPVTDDHAVRFELALLEYRQARGAEPDRNWRALLYLATALPELWERVRRHLDLHHGEADLSAVGAEALSAGERALLELAKALFAGGGPVDVAHMADVLDGRLWEVALAALREYRAGR